MSLSRMLHLIAFICLTLAACDPRMEMDGDAGWNPLGCAMTDGAPPNFATDPKNCGACGVVCQVGETCQNGLCNNPPQLNCGAQGKAECSGACFDLMTDKRHCGACNTACNNAQCVQGICVDQGCVPVMPTKCGNICTNLYFDSANCGQCGKRCSNKYPACEGGICVKLGKP